MIIPNIWENNVPTHQPDELKPGTWDPKTLVHVASVPSNVSREKTGTKDLLLRNVGNGGMIILPCPAFQQDEPQIFVHIAQ